MSTYMLIWFFYVLCGPLPAFKVWDLICSWYFHDIQIKPNRRKSNPSCLLCLCTHTICPHISQNIYLDFEADFLSLGTQGVWWQFFFSFDCGRALWSLVWFSFFHQFKNNLHSQYRKWYENCKTMHQIFLGKARFFFSEVPSDNSENFHVTSISGQVFTKELYFPQLLSNSLSNWFPNTTPCFVFVVAPCPVL